MSLVHHCPSFVSHWLTNVPHCFQLSLERAPMHCLIHSYHVGNILSLFGRYDRHCGPSSTISGWKDSKINKTTYGLLTTLIYKTSHGNGNVKMRWWFRRIRTKFECFWQESNSLRVFNEFWCWTTQWVIGDTREVIILQLSPSPLMHLREWILYFRPTNKAKIITWTNRIHRTGSFV